MTWQSEICYPESEKKSSIFPIFSINTKNEQVKAFIPKKDWLTEIELLTNLNSKYYLFFHFTIKGRFYIFTVNINQ